MNRLGDRVSPVWRIVALVRPHIGRFALATLALVAGSAISLAYPQGARLAIDLGIGGGSAAWLDKIVAGLLAVFAVHAGLVWLRHYLMSWLGQRVVADLRGQVFDHLLALPPGWFHERRTGELVGRLASDVSSIESVVGAELSLVLRNGMQLFGGVVLLLVVNAKLTFYMLLVVPPIALGAVAFGRVIRRMAAAVQDRLAEASGQVQEAIGAIETVQAFASERREVAAYGLGVEAAFDQSVHLARWRATFLSSVSAAGYVALAVVVWLGGHAVVRGEILPGELTAFMLYTLMVATALASVAGLWGSLQRAAGATARLYAILDAVPEIRDSERPTSLPDGKGAVSFRNVWFHYAARPDHAVLRGVDLDVAPGQLVALVGPSGAGKSTLTSLLLRFYDVTEGAILLEDIDVRALKLAQLRKALAIVAQEPVLFSCSIRDNIGYGCNDMTQEAMEAAARGAHAHDFIVSFPDGYDTLVGERGVQLSGGQRQRIAIARAILADPRVLILDEATSNLDAESEALVQEALARLTRQRTTIVIAHRLSTVRDADHIVMLDHGRIVEAGTHDVLMALNGGYRRLVEHQVIVSDD